MLSSLVSGLCLALPFLPVVRPVLPASLLASGLVYGGLVVLACRQANCTAAQ